MRSGIVDSAVCELAALHILIDLIPTNFHKDRSRKTVDNRAMRLVVARHVRRQSLTIVLRNCVGEMRIECVGLRMPYRATA
ncbi:hypothetical protein ACFPTO_14450 [Paraburkholderia denitrificans]|uniref:Transposase n=1 Tax=Paraburkholderia denitrificans TaxID=694025 RepID=A0ABW0JA78_9BURK